MSTSAKISKLSDEALSGVTGGNFTDRYGTAGADNIITGDGMDKVFAGAGNDYVESNGGTDEVHAGEGNDVVSLGAGNDKAFGDAGNDTIQGGAGSDEMHGGQGDDALLGGRFDGAADKAFGGEGSDSYAWWQGSGSDEFHGGNGQDTLFLPDINLDTLNSALKLYDSGLEMLVNSSGDVTFHDKVTGEERSFSGEINVGGETLKFFNVEKLQIKF
jgi:Ca2+-binding RTX toxin-like protein